MAQPINVVLNPTYCVGGLVGLSIFRLLTYFSAGLYPEQLVSLNLYLICKYKISEKAH